MNAPLHHTGHVTILVGDVRERLRDLPANSFDCVVTSPPYWGLRDYGVPGQIGCEPTLGEHLALMVDVFRDVRRILKSHGTCWLNYGDCYAAAPNGRSAAEYKAAGDDDRTFRDKPFSTVGPIFTGAPLRAGRSTNLGNVASDGVRRNYAGEGYLKPKDLCMIPNRLAIALQDDGWWVRSEIIWHKPNPMPESVYDRPTSAHEKIWLLTKSEEYFYNHGAIRENVTGGAHARAPGPNSREAVDRTPRSRKIKVPGGWDVEPGAHGTINRSGRTEATYRDEPGVTPKSAPENTNIKAKGSFHASTTQLVETRNARNVWTIAPKAFREAHFATFPPALAERCIKAGTPPTVCAACGAVHSCGGICQVFGRNPGRVLDPFGGAGTVGLVAKRLGLDCTLIELNPEYAAMAERRIAGSPA
jgi:DNA modification methylase